MILPEDKPLCKEENPELWFPVAYDFRQYGPKREEAMGKALQAMAICNKCPLFANGQCLELALKGVSSVDYGIWGGTLPIERQNATDSVAMASEGEVWQMSLRRRADEMGLIKPYIPRQSRPKSRYYLFTEQTA